MAEDGGPSVKSGADIPYFFYDIIARITPGAFLIAGVILSWNGPAFFAQLHCFLEKAVSADLSAGVATVLTAVGLIAFLGISSFSGFLLASISHVVIEQGIFHWWPIKLDGLTEFLGIEGIEELMLRFRTQFGSSFKEGSLNRASFLCSYYVWRVDPNLGAMTARLDAELLAAQSVLLVSLGLIAWVLKKSLCQWFDSYLVGWLAILATITFGAWLTFKYHRKKRIYARFAFFLAASHQEMPPPTKT